MSGSISSEDDENSSDYQIIQPVMPAGELGPLDVHVSRLVPDVLATLFSYLSVSDRCKAMLVCTGWRDIAYNKSVWRGGWFCLEEMPEDPKRMFRSLARRGIRRLETSRADVLRMAVKHMPNLLTELYLYCNELSEQNISRNMMRNMSNLTELTLSETSLVTDSTIERFTQHLKKLVRLTLERCNQLTDVSFRHIANGLPALKWLRVESIELLTDVGVGYLSGHGCPNPADIPALEYLSLWTGNSDILTDQSLRYLSVGQASLVELELYFTQLTDDGMFHLAKMGKLKKLFVVSSNIGAAGMAHLAEGGSKVTQLNLKDYCQLGKIGLQHLGRMTHLLDLDLSNCFITDADLELLPNCGSNIKILKLVDCFGLTNNAMEHVAKLKGLRELTADDLEDDGLGFLAAAGSQVAILKFRVRVTDVGLRHLTNLTNLQQVSLCGSITHEALSHFVDCVDEKMTNLDLLYIDCGVLDCRTLLCVARGLFRLETLSLSRKHVDEDGKAAAARNLPRLRRLYVDHKNIIDEVRSLRHFDVVQ